MKLKTHNPDSCPVQRRSDPIIHLNTKTGLFTINKAACILMKIGGGDKIIFHNEEENPENWYLQNVGKKGAGFEVRGKDDDFSNGVLFNNSNLARKIADSVAFEGLSGRLKVGEAMSVKGVGELWTVITASLRNK